MRPTLRQLEAFVAVATTGSFGAAASAIHASPSAASALIKELESLLSARLFERTTRRVQLTQAGEAMRESAVRALREVERAASQVRAVQAREIGVVSVAAPPLLAAKLLVPVAKQLRRVHPGLSVKILDIPTIEIGPLLRTGQVDLAIGTPRQAEDGMAIHPLLKGPLFVVMPRRHQLAAKRAVPIAQLVLEPLVLQFRSSPLREDVEALFVRHQLQPQVIAEAAQLATLVSMVEAGFGVSVMPCYTPILEHMKGVVARPLQAAGAASEVAVIREADHPLSPASEAFVEVAMRFINTRWESAGQTD
jgi:LysR family transcriptional regulator, carnitine catabolism transcriptional activator